MMIAAAAKKEITTVTNNTTTPERLQDTDKMKLNVKNIRYLLSDDWRVLRAVCSPTTTTSLFSCIVGEQR